jgi:hypothetical protein
MSRAHRGRRASSAFASEPLVKSKAFEGNRPSFSAQSSTRTSCSVLPNASALGYAKKLEEDVVAGCVAEAGTEGVVRVGGDELGSDRANPQSLANSWQIWHSMSQSMCLPSVSKAIVT